MNAIPFDRKSVHCSHIEGSDAVRKSSLLLTPSQSRWTAKGTIAAERLIEQLSGIQKMKVTLYWRVKVRLSLELQGTPKTLAMMHNANHFLQNYGNFSSAVLLPGLYDSIRTALCVRKSLPKLHWVSPTESPGESSTRDRDRRLASDTSSCSQVSHL